MPKNQRVEVAVGHADFSFADFLYPEYGGDTFLRNVGSHKIYTGHHIPIDGIIQKILSFIFVAINNEPPGVGK
jgi:hypothetical protein